MMHNEQLILQALKMNSEAIKTIDKYNWSIKYLSIFCTKFKNLKS